MWKQFIVSHRALKSRNVRNPGYASSLIEGFLSKIIKYNAPTGTQNPNMAIVAQGLNSMSFTINLRTRLKITTIQHIHLEHR
jgi:hypothetical protein